MLYFKATTNKGFIAMSVSGKKAHGKEAVGSFSVFKMFILRIKVHKNGFTIYLLVYKIYILILNLLFIYYT